MLEKIRFLNSNSLKMIAAITMLIDHIGVIFFPESLVLRAIGRISFPIFAFMISEGARYTKNRLKYILAVGILGVICQIPMIILFNDFHWNVLVTLTLSLGLIYLLNWFKESLFDKECGILVKSLSLALFIIAAFSLYFSETHLSFNCAYGFYGCMASVFASAPSLNKTDAPDWLKRLDCIPVRVLCMLFPLLIYSHISFKLQYCSIIAVIPLLLYSGKKGKANMKHFFYIFYPAHLVILYGISLFV